MSMWDWDEQGDSFPLDEGQQYRDPYASQIGSSNYRGANQSYSDNSHHHHDHTGHSHNQHQHGSNDNAHSYHGQRLGGASPSRQNYGARHESYEDPSSRQSYGQDSFENGRNHQNHRQPENQGHDHDSQGHAFSMAHAPVVQLTHYGGHQGYDASAGYEIRQEHHAPLPSPGHGHEATNRTDLFTSDSVVNLTLDEIDALARTHRSRSWLVVLYAPWCRFCQAMEPNFERVAQRLENSSIYVGRFQADGDYKEYAKRYLQLEHFPTILFFPKDSSNIVKYHSENREVDAILGFVQAFE